jgi:hypothetical protein
MSTVNLTSDEIEILRQCLRAAADGPFFPEWEFQTLIGASREEVRALISQTALDREERAVDIATSTLNNLLGYPHGAEKVLRSFVSASSAELKGLLEKLLTHSPGRDV